MNKYIYKLTGLDCAACAREVEERLEKEKYLYDVNVNFSLMRLTFKSNKQINDKEILKIIKSVEPEVEFNTNNEKNKVTKDIIRLTIGILISITGLILKQNIIIIIGYLILLYRTMINSIKLLSKKQINENLLITISCIGAYIIGSTIEGLIVISLYEIGKVLESLAINKSRKEVTNLINLEEEYANVKNNNSIEKVKIEKVKIGSTIIIKQGERIPLDGIITKGSCKLDTSSITGESDLKECNINDQIISGCINKEGLIEAKVTSDYTNNTVKRILDLVENASDKKANTELTVNKLSKTYTTIVILLSIIIAIISPLITKLTYTESIYKALIFLVISCPCAIAISIPLSYFSAIGTNSSNGILVKGSNYIDSIRGLDEIVLDKTGTITTGNFKVKDIVLLTKDYSKKDIIQVLAQGESLSNHPIARSIIDYCNIHPDTNNITDYKEIDGKGISYKINNKKVLIGTKDFCNYKGNINSRIFINYDNQIVAYILLEDEIKNKSKKTINKLKELGIKISMLTGDNKEKTTVIAEKLGIDNYKYELLPQDKYNYIDKQIINNKKIAFVGDGINDTPSLVRATVGISMGGIGTDAAIESSDIVIMNDDLSKIITSIEISNKTNKIIKENLILAILTKIIVLSLSLYGITGMWQAIFADVGVTIITIFNTLRILKYKSHH